MAGPAATHRALGERRARQRTAQRDPRRPPALLRCAFPGLGWSREAGQLFFAVTPPAAWLQPCSVILDAFWCLGGVFCCRPALGAPLSAYTRKARDRRGYGNLLFSFEPMSIISERLRAGGGPSEAALGERHTAHGVNCT